MAVGKFWPPPHRIHPLDRSQKLLLVITSATQGRGGGPKASTSWASEAARAKAELDCATLWVCFAYKPKPSITHVFDCHLFSFLALSFNYFFDWSGPVRVLVPSYSYRSPRHCGDPYGSAKFGADPSTGGASGGNIANFIYLFFFSFFRELTYRSDPSTDFHAWWLKRRGLAQGCAFWGFVDIALNSGVKYPQTLIFGGENGQNIKSFILSKLPHQFQQKFAQRYRSPSGHRGLSQSRPTNPRWRHFEKNR